MAKIQPPPPQTQQIDSRQWKDWLYTVYNAISGTGGTFGTMAYQNDNAVAITGGAIGGVGISGSTINTTPIGSVYPSSGSFTSLKLNSVNGYIKGTSGTFSASSTIPNTDITGLGTISTQNASSVAITGGSIDGATIGVTTPSSAVVTSLKTTSTITANGIAVSGSHVTISKWLPIVCDGTTYYIPLYT